MGEVVAVAENNKCIFNETCFTVSVTRALCCAVVRYCAVVIAAANRVLFFSFVAVLCYTVFYVNFLTVSFFVAWFYSGSCTVLNCLTFPQCTSIIFWLLYCVALSCFVLT